MPEEEELEVPISASKESMKESMKMDTDEPANKSDVNMQDAKVDPESSASGLGNETPEAEDKHADKPEDKPVEMETDNKVCEFCPALLVKLLIFLI